MNVQANKALQLSSQVPNQTGSQLPVVPQQNGVSIPSQMQNLGNRPDLTKVRGFMLKKIYETILRKHRPTQEGQAKKLKDIVRHLEEGLFRSASSQEEYMNFDTLESRLHVMIKRQSPHHPRFPHQNNVSSVGKMIPTPGLSNGGNPNMMDIQQENTSLICTEGNNSITSSINKNGSSQSTGNMASDALQNGFKSEVYQARNNIISDMGGKNVPSRMMPTPGFLTNGNHSSVKMEFANTTHGFSTVNSAMLPQKQLQHQHVGGQNSRVLTGSQVGKQQKLCGYSKGSMGGRISDSHSKIISYGNLSKSPQQHSDHSQSSLSQGDAYDLRSVISSVPGNVYGTASPAGSSLASLNLKSTGMLSVANSKSNLRTNLSNLLDTQQNAGMKPQPIDGLEKINASAYPSKEILSHQQFCQQQFQPHRDQQQCLVKNEPDSISKINSDLAVQVKSEHSSDLHSQVCKNNQASKLQNQPQHKSDYSDQNSQIQVMHPQQMISESQVSSLSVEGKPASLTMGQQQALPKEYVQELSHRIARQGDAQCNDFSPEPSIVSQTLMPGSTEEPISSGGATCPVNASRERSFVNQQKWIIFLKHAEQCKGQEGRCRDSNCPIAQKLLKHVDQCGIVNCPYARCHQTKILLGHYKTCKDQGCPVCVPVKSFLSNLRKSTKSRLTKTEGASAVVTSKCMTTDASDSFSPALKRLKIEQSSESETYDYGKSTLSTLPLSQQDTVQGRQLDVYYHDDACLPVKWEFRDTTKGFFLNSGQGNPMMNGVAKDEKDGFYNQRQHTQSVLLDETSKFDNQEVIKAEKDIAQPKQEISASPMECVAKSGKPKIKGVSLIELFTPEQVMQHIMGLKQWTGQSKAKAERNQAMENFMSENSCRLCAVERLTFDPPPLYCTPCGIRIKRNAAYYTFGMGDTRNFLCVPCYHDARGDNITVDGNIVLKSRLEKKRNDEEAEEWWVQCDKCERWQHQICALFNGKRNDGGQAEYTCPQCYMEEIDQGERKPLPQSSVLGAKDLPRTILSDHIEERLNKRLKWEREERARVQGKGYGEVPSAEALVVRVVSSVDKKLEVKHRFLDLFQEENYPREFPYKSKVVLLFQKIEGVEVCLFGMYVQEFGAESQHPNQRRVYLSYLDSVKYFRPEIKAVTGEALRTFVYHEILIGYLEYCKKRGFTSCYIWACPPLKGEDYILYCHPEIQKTPKSDKLREWYLSMLQKASKENIVVELTNLYDHFFTSTGECKAKVTAARLPYFDGDYWPGAAEDIIYQIQQEEEDKKLNLKGSAKKTAIKRALKTSGQLDLPANASKDQLLMHKLGETIFPMKEDFIMVHLQHACTHCCILMVSGSRWVCGQCNNFQLCDKCYEAEQVRDKSERHPVHHKEKHSIYRVEIADVPLDTKDKDEILESEFFDTRQAFLSLCQGNHYQYDTLRRAKHSSMMVLYHLHNPTAPAYVTTCNVCNIDIDAGQGWRCEVCPEYDVCNSCYHKGTDHPHKLTNHPSNVESDAQNQEARQQRVLQLRKMLDLLVHASQCRSSICQYPNCCKVKGLFRHGITCKIKASGGCGVCKKMWYLLQLHARACKESECHVPRCRDLKMHTRRIQQQSDSRRRAAVMEMMRQRAAEIAGNS